MAKHMNYILSLLFISSFLSVNAHLSITDYGAIGDGKTDATQSFLKGWTTACHLNEPTTIFVLHKWYRLGLIIFEGPCNNTGITIQVDGILVALNYQEIGTVDNWVVFSGVQGVSINGNGRYLDEQGLGWKKEGVQNVTVKTVVFNGSLNGLRIKSWARPSYGFVKGVVIEHATMINVANPIIIDQNYCPNDNEGCPGQI